MAGQRLVIPQLHHLMQCHHVLLEVLLKDGKISLVLFDVVSNSFVPFAIHGYTFNLEAAVIVVE